MCNINLVLSIINNKIKPVFRLQCFLNAITLNKETATYREQCICTFRVLYFIMSSVCRTEHIQTVFQLFRTVAVVIASRLSFSF
jgi:hypothetical protein